LASISPEISHFEAEGLSSGLFPNVLRKMEAFEMAEIYKIIALKNVVSYV
jgi:hypothetical protein